MKKLYVLLFSAALACSCASAPREKPFSVNLNSPRIQAGSIEAYLDTSVSLGGSLKKNDITVYYYPADDAVCLEFKIMFAPCNQFWDRDGREAFVSAFERYREEYEQRTLVTKGGNRKTRELYGEVQGFFMWKKTSIGVQAHGNPKIKLGYQFNKQAVFFTTTQMESEYTDPQSRSRNQTSPVTEIFFTRSQAESLVALFKQEYLRGLGGVPKTETGATDQSETDKY